MTAELRKRLTRASLPCERVSEGGWSEEGTYLDVAVRDHDDLVRLEEVPARSEAGASELEESLDRDEVDEGVCK